MHGVTPDIVTMAKGICNGLPMAAVVTTPALAESLKGTYFYSTFGGNPVACAAGLAVLNVSCNHQHVTVNYVQFYKQAELL
jgi:alanine-glyoxylate transaminase/(R)-3-amino-2-methylpropionate-pyruvate transaminase